MDKEKYLKALESRLNFLRPEDKMNVIFNISNDLDNKKEVKDISTLVEDLKRTYNVSDKSSDKKANILNIVSKRIQCFINTVKKNSIKDNLIILRDIIILGLITSILKIPFIAVETLFFQVFGEILSLTIFDVFNFVCEMLYVIFGILFFITKFKKRFKKELGIE